MRRNTKIVAPLLVGTVALFGLSACSADGSASPAASQDAADPIRSRGTEVAGAAITPITITAGGRTIAAELNDSQVSRDFAATLPTTLAWFRNAGIEYITELDAPLTESGPFYTDVQPGDLVYYNPRDSITIIYSETVSVPTLTKMGEITSDLGVFEELPDNVEMRVEIQGQ